MNYIVNTLTIHNQHILATVSSIASVLEDCVSPGIHHVLAMEEALVKRNLYTKESKYGGIFGLENLLLKASCNPNLTQGVFYILPIYCNGQLFVR